MSIDPAYSSATVSRGIIYLMNGDKDKAATE
jgi:hypothetical protein